MYHLHNINEAFVRPTYITHAQRNSEMESLGLQSQHRDTNGPDSNSSQSDVSVMDIMSLDDSLEQSMESINSDNDIDIN